MKQGPTVQQDINPPLQEAMPSGYPKESTIWNVLPSAVCVCDRSGVITYCNKAAVELWGKMPQTGEDHWWGFVKMFTLEGQPLAPQDDPVAQCLREAKSIHGQELLVETTDGSKKIITLHSTPLYDANGTVSGAMNVITDITERKNLEKALLESEEKYHALAAGLEKIVEEKTFDLKMKNEELKRSEERYHKMIEEVEDYAIILLDRNGIIQNWNRGAEKIKGYTENEIVGKSFSNFYLPEDRNNGLPQKLLGEAIQKGKALHEGWRMRKDGSRFWGSIVLTALHDDQNEIIGFSKVTRDLTERKLSEDKVREYTNQLEFQNKELEQFAYATSHDMKEPLRKIHLYNSFIVENAANTLDGKSKEFLNRSVNAVKRMTDLIEDLLAYCKTTGSAESFEEVALEEVVEEIILMHKDEFEQKDVQIEAQNLPTIYAIPFQMKQLMFNLINNSIKYKHPDRDVHIEIKSELIKGSEVKEKEGEPLKKYYKISIIDNGIGFDPQYAEKIFNIFQRLSNLPSAKGSGIGLAICKRIVQNHHGFIKATGKENQGARFDIYLPQMVHLSSD